MPEPREPRLPPEPVCACHGWPGSVCDARRAARFDAFGRWLPAALWAASALTWTALSYSNASGPDVVVCSVLGVTFGMHFRAALGGDRA